MIYGYDEARLTVQRDLAKEIDWFTPPDERHFDPISVVSILAGILLTGFLAGFTEEAGKAAKKAGVNVYQKLEELVKNLFSGKKSADTEDLDELAAQAPKTIRDIDEKQILFYLTSTEDKIKMYLESNLPSDRATSLAKTVRQAAESLLLIGGQVNANINGESSI